jgi:hypothetical protein
MDLLTNHMSHNIYKMVYQYFWPKPKGICTLDLYFEILIVRILASVRCELFKMSKASHLTIILFYNHETILFIMSNAYHVVIYILKYLDMVPICPYMLGHSHIEQNIWHSSCTLISFSHLTIVASNVLTINLVHVHYMLISLGFEKS